MKSVLDYFCNLSGSKPNSKKSFSIQDSLVGPIIIASVASHCIYSSFCLNDLAYAFSNIMSPWCIWGLKNDLYSDF